MTNNFQEKVNFIWSIADLLRGDYKKHEYQDVILPLTVLRRLDAVLEPTKELVLKRAKELKERGLEDDTIILSRVAKYPFYNISPFTFKKLVQDPNNIAKNLRSYINGFSENMRDILDNFKFMDEIKRLDEANLLFLIIQKSNEINLHPDKVSNYEMGTIFEELIRKFSEQSNEEAGEHFTPREVIRLMVRLIFAGNGRVKKPNIIEKIYDPACGTGGMLTIAKDEILEHINKTATIFLFGQELNPKTYAIAKSDILIKGEEAGNIKEGNSFSKDQLNSSDDKFDYMLSNPPFGVEWKRVQKVIRREYEERGFNGRFGAGLPRINDGSFLFLQHMISKMKPINEGGSRIAIVFNGSPLFTGDAGSGESEIRRWIIENDWLEAIIGLPDQLFYNTGIFTYIWIITNRKLQERQGKVQLIDAREFYEKMKKSLGNKRHFITAKQIKEIIDIYKGFRRNKRSKIFDNKHFGYHKITVERPKKDKSGNIIKNKKGEPEPDPELRDFEKIPLKENIYKYFEREVKPYVPDAWIDEKKTKVGYEISFTKYFYEYQPLRPLEEIEKDIKTIEKGTDSLMKEIFK